jgi:acetate---CoA ligase (ADP-forming) subunit beta
MSLLSYEKTVKLLEKYKLPTAKAGLVKNLESAKKAAKAMGYPVVIKAVSPQIIHKTEFGAVKVNIQDEAGLNLAYEALLKDVKKAKAKLEGILVQKQETGREIIIGFKRDSNFDTVLMVGLGGIFVEVFHDISLRIPPIDKKEALMMLSELKGNVLLTGFRKSKPVNVDALANILVKVSELSLEKEIEEVDFNPVLVNEQKAIIVDARIIVEK